MKKILSIFICILLTITMVANTTKAYAATRKTTNGLSSKNITIQQFNEGTVYSGKMLSENDESWIQDMAELIYGENSSGENFKVINKKVNPITVNTVVSDKPDDNTDVINTLEKMLAINPRGAVVTIAAALATGSTIIPYTPLAALCAAASVFIADKASNCETTYEFITQYQLRGANGTISYAQSIVTYKNPNRTGYITSTYHWWQPK